jgi:antitoxin (DNA-binding transcriptional repressor) of toxin-antitoxin stability system
MERIGVRELRQHASRWLARVARGESFEVTDRGRMVALLIPPPLQEGLAPLLATGRAQAGIGHLRDLEPPRRPRPGGPTATEALEQLRADER